MGYPRGSFTTIPLNFVVLQTDGIRGIPLAFRSKHDAISILLDVFIVPNEHGINLYLHTMKTLPPIGPIIKYTHLGKQEHFSICI